MQPRDEWQATLGTQAVKHGLPTQWTSTSPKLRKAQATKITSCEDTRSKAMATLARLGGANTYQGPQNSSNLSLICASRRQALIRKRALGLPGGGNNNLLCYVCLSSIFRTITPIMRISDELCQLEMAKYGEEAAVQQPLTVKS